MKRILLSIFLVLLFATSSFATTWYACEGSQDINYAGLWNDAATCDGNVLTWNAQVAGDIFEANAKTALNINVDPQGTGAGKGKVHLKNLSGGGFVSYMDLTLTITADITGGTADCFVISGSGNNTLTIAGNLAGSSTANKEAIHDSRTGATSNVIVNGTITADVGPGYYKANNGGLLTVNGNNTGSSVDNIPGLYIYGNSTTTINADCIGGGSTSYESAPGCHSYSGASVSMTITGNIINSLYSHGATGKYIWAPSSALKYIKVNGGGTPVYASVPPANTDVKTGVQYVDPVDGTTETGTYTATGGGAWAH